MVRRRSTKPGPLGRLLGYVVPMALGGSLAFVPPALLARASRGKHTFWEVMTTQEGAWILMAFAGGFGLVVGFLIARWSDRSVHTRHGLLGVDPHQDNTSS